MSCPDARHAYPPASSESGLCPQPAAPLQAPDKTPSPRRQAGRGRLCIVSRIPGDGDQTALTASIRRFVIWLSVARLAETVIVSLSFAGTKSRTWLPEDSPAQPWPAPVTDR